MNRINKRKHKIDEMSLFFFLLSILGNQEISAFGKQGEGDSGDHWKVICSNSFWERNQAVRLKHVDTEA